MTKDQHELCLQWVEALESGKYSQCQETLRVNGANSYCCLGVALDTINPLSWHGNKHYHVNGDFNGYSVSYIHDYIAINIFGLSREDQYNLQNLNDQYRKNFLEIAQYIRNNILTRFKGAEGVA